jgi:hypothetical protein
MSGWLLLQGISSHGADRPLRRRLLLHPRRRHEHAHWRWYVHGRVLLPRWLDKCRGEWHCVWRGPILQSGFRCAGMPGRFRMPRRKRRENTVSAGNVQQCDRHVVSSRLSRWLSLLVDTAHRRVGSVSTWLILFVGFILGDWRWIMPRGLCVSGGLVERDRHWCVRCFGILSCGLSVACGIGPMQFRILLCGQRR